MSHFIDSTAELGSEEEDGDYDEENDERQDRPRKPNGVHVRMDDSSEEDEEDDEEEIRKVSRSRTEFAIVKLTCSFAGPRRLHRR